MENAVEGTDWRALAERSLAEMDNQCGCPCCNLSPRNAERAALVTALRLALGK